jgi:hypothetical protein
MKHRLRMLELAIQRADTLSTQGIIIDVTIILTIWNDYVENGILPDCTLCTLSET